MQQDLLATIAAPIEMLETERRLMESITASLQTMMNAEWKMTEAVTAPLKMLEQQSKIAEIAAAPLRMIENERKLREAIAAPLEAMMDTERRLMNAALASLKLIETERRVIELAAAPLKIAEQQRRLVDASTVPLKMLEQQPKIAEIAASPLRMVETEKKLREAITAPLKVMDHQRDLLKALSAPLKVMEKEQRMMKAITAHLGASLSSQQALIRNATAALAATTSLATHFDSIQDIGASELAVDSTRALAALMERLETLSTEDQLRELVNAIIDSKDSKLKAILLSVFAAFLFWIIEPVLTPVRLLLYNKSHHRHEAVQIVRQEVVKERLAPAPPYRVAKHDMIRVKQTRKRKSPVVGYLRVGEIVRVIEKPKKQCLVEWYSEDSGEIVSGWAFSKHLQVVK